MAATPVVLLRTKGPCLGTIIEVLIIQAAGSLQVHHECQEAQTRDLYGKGGNVPRLALPDLDQENQSPMVQPLLDHKSTPISRHMLKMGHREEAKDRLPVEMTDRRHTEMIGETADLHHIEMIAETETIEIGNIDETIVTAMMDLDIGTTTMTIEAAAPESATGHETVESAIGGWAQIIPPAQDRG